MFGTLVLCVCIFTEGHSWCRFLFRDVAALYVSSTEYEVGESPLRSHRHSWRQQIFLRVATPQKNTDVNGKDSEQIRNEINTYIDFEPRHLQFHLPLASHVLMYVCQL